MNVLPTGICLEALCCPRSSQPTCSTSTCLKALVTLLQCAQSRTYLISLESNSLGVELSNVLHRLMLTRDSPAIQLLVIDALELVLKADRENLNLRRAAKIKGSKIV
jgi:HEAT repeat-containing protein 5